ncbi:MAG: carbon storage regulator CsrA [Candidatus Coatesbacteria bacterium]|nr:carbon storage regulator CsrA [Candidatus Coatesbacteria bacterium]
MLVLTRKRDESIIIGDDIEIMVVDINANEVRIGISAPRELSVHRKEVYEAILRENIAAKLSLKQPIKLPKLGTQKKD